MGSHLPPESIQLSDLAPDFSWDLRWRGVDQQVQWTSG